MKKYCFLFASLLLGFIVLGSYAQDKQEQLWYGWEETVKPEKRAEYIELCNELVRLCQQEEFPFAYFTWSSNPMIFTLWTPIKSLNDIERIGQEWDKIIKTWGEEKYKAFNATKLHNREFTAKMRNDMEYIPENPNYKRSEFVYARWIELYPKVGKDKDIEAAIKWLNEKRKSIDYDSYCMYGVGGIGYESPCHLISYADLTQKDFLSREHSKKLGADWEQFLNKIRPLLRKPSKFFDWNLHKDLSYTPVEN